MKNLNKYIDECLQDLDLLGIPYRKVRKWEINTRAKSRWGLCRLVERGEFEISIACSLLEDDVDDQALKNTIVHELLHTIPGCFDHKGKWKQYAGLINRTFPEYTIKRTASVEEKGITAIQAVPKYRYVLKCTKCGNEVRRERESKLVKNPQNYRCGLCYGRLIRIT